jgi:hypothetical protein
MTTRGDFNEIRDENILVEKLKTEIKGLIGEISSICSIDELKEKVRRHGFTATESSDLGQEKGDKRYYISLNIPRLGDEMFYGATINDALKSMKRELAGRFEAILQVMQPHET